MCPHKVDVELKYDASVRDHAAQHRRLVIEQCIESLTHSCLCHDPYCRRHACMKMKRVVIHTRICKRKAQGDCPICKQLIALCCYHARNCRMTRCAVPFCETLKQKLRRQSMLDEARGLRRPHINIDESRTIDVNMAGDSAFGDDSTSAAVNASQRTEDESGPSGIMQDIPRPPPLRIDDDSSDNESLIDETPLNEE